MRQQHRQLHRPQLDAGLLLARRRAPGCWSARAPGRRRRRRAPTGTGRNACPCWPPARRRRPDAAAGRRRTGRASRASDGIPDPDDDPPGQRDDVRRDAESERDLDVHDRQQDRQPAPPLEHVRQQRGTKVGEVLGQSPQARPIGQGQREGTRRPRSASVGTGPKSATLAARSSSASQSRPRCPAPPGDRPQRRASRHARPRSTGEARTICAKRARLAVLIVVSWRNLAPPGGLGSPPSAKTCRRVEILGEQTGRCRATRVRTGSPRVHPRSRAGVIPRPS